MADAATFNPNELVIEKVRAVEELSLIHIYLATLFILDRKEK